MSCWGQVGPDPVTGVPLAWRGEGHVLRGIRGSARRHLDLEVQPPDGGRGPAALATPFLVICDSIHREQQGHTSETSRSSPANLTSNHKDRTTGLDGWEARGEEEAGL